MAVIGDMGAGQQANLTTAQTGNGQTTNVVQRRVDRPLAAALVRITTTVGSTPTCTYQLEGSADGATWYPLISQDITTAGPPGTLTSATFTIISATTKWLQIPVDTAWTFARITFSANTNVTNTVDVWVY
jgi:hypothetical protein